MVQSTISLVFNRDGLPWHVACILLELSLIVAGLLRKPVPPPPPLFRHEALVLLPRPPPWPD